MTGCDTPPSTPVPAAPSASGDSATPTITPLATPSRKTRRPVRRPTPKPTIRRTPVRVNGIPAVWLRLVECESSGRWRIHNAPYEGGPQFHWKTWRDYRLPSEPVHAYDAAPVVQITVARRILRDQGVGAWPVCGPKVGLTRAAA